MPISSKISRIETDLKRWTEIGLGAYDIDRTSTHFVGQIFLATKGGIFLC